MTPSETPRYDADNPRYRPRIPSVRAISYVIAKAGGSARWGLSIVDAVVGVTEAVASSALAEATIGPGSDDRVTGGAGVVEGTDGER
jgi:hypothetical protein